MHWLLPAGNMALLPVFLAAFPGVGGVLDRQGVRAISLGSDIGVFLDGVRRFRAYVVQRDERA